MSANPIQAESFTASLEMAVELHQNRQFQQARYCYLQYIKANPTDAAAFKMLSVLYHECNEYQLALQSINRAIQLEPEQAAFWVIRSSFYFESQQWAESISDLRRGQMLQPTNVDIYQKLGYAYSESKQFDEAVGCLKRAIELSPDQPDGYSNLGATYIELRQFEQAEVQLKRALDLDSNHETTLASLGLLYLKQGRLIEAEQSLQLSLSLKPGFVKSKSLLAKVLKDQGRLEEAVQYYRDSLQPKNPEDFYWSNYLLTLQYWSGISSKKLYQEAFDWGRSVSARTPKLLSNTIDRNEERKLRIGYVSADLRNHPVGYFIENVLKAHDRERFEIHCYSNAKVEDELSQRISASVDYWNDIHSLNDESAARLIQGDGIDVLVDLSGHTADHRLFVFARKPAPVQATWMAYFATTGLPEMDVIIADQFVIPPQEERYYIENVERLPNCYLCFTPPCMEVSVNELPFKKNDYITFGCFNAISKLNDNVFSLWADLLKKVANSRLLLKTYGFDEEIIRQRVIASFQKLGISSERIMLEGNSPRIELLSTYNQIDIALDPFPFNGGTTTVEALWMGVPVVTLRGDRFVAHVGETIMQALGRPEWIASTDEDYVCIAAELAQNVDSLQELRSLLRAQLCQSPLCDAETFTRDLETLYRRLWHECIHQNQTFCTQSA